jgi:hypothetical protein
MQWYRGHRIEVLTVEEASHKRSHYFLHNAKIASIFERMYELLTDALVP